MKPDWQSFKENIQRGNTIRKEIAELDLLVPRKPYKMTIVNKNPVSHFHVHENNYGLLAIALLTTLFVFLIIMIANKVTATNGGMARDEKLSWANSHVPVPDMNGVGSTPTVPISQSLDVLNSDVKNAQPTKSALSSKDAFQCTAEKLLYPTGTGECR